MCNQNVKPIWVESKGVNTHTELVLLAANVGCGKSIVSFKTKRRGSKAPSTSL